MIIFCKTCRGILVREEQMWKHKESPPANGHDPAPVAARRCRLFDPDVVGLPGYDKVLARLVARERAAGTPMEAWRIGVYLFDGRIRGVFRYAAEVGKIPPGSPFQPPQVPSRTLLRSHPIVKERLARR